MTSFLTPASVLPSLLRGEHFVIYERDTIVNTGTGRLPGARSAGYVEKGYGDARYISLAVGANKVYEVCNSAIVNQTAIDGTSRAFLDLPFDYSRVINPNLPLTVAAGDCFVGIEVGSNATAPPWDAAGFAINPPQGVPFQLRYNFTLSRFEMAAFNAIDDPFVKVCTYQPTFTPDNNVTEFRLRWNHLAKQMDAYLNGVHAGSMTAAEYPDIMAVQGALGEGFGYFLTNGSDATNQMLEVGFYRAHVWRPRVLYT